MTAQPDRRRLDLRGVPCPLTWARAKAVLEGLSAGSVVELITDDARSAQDIPMAAEAEGYVVLASARIDATTTVIEIER